MSKIILNDNDLVTHPLSSGSVFYYKDKLYVSWNPIGLNILEKLPIQKVKPTNFLYLETPVWELNNYEHRVRIQECTPYMVKELLLALCNLHIELHKCGLFLHDVHEANINYTQDGIVWLDLGSIKVGKGHTEPAFFGTCYLAQKYLYNDFKFGHTKYNIKQLQKSTAPIRNLVTIKENTLVWNEFKKIINNKEVKIKKS